MRQLRLFPTLAIFALFAVAVIASGQYWSSRQAPLAGDILVAQQQPPPRTAASYCPSNTRSGPFVVPALPSLAVPFPVNARLSHAANLSQGFRLTPGVYAFAIADGAVSFWPADTGNGGNAWTATAYMNWWRTETGNIGAAYVNPSAAYRPSASAAGAANRGKGVSITVGDRPGNQNNFDIFMYDAANAADNRGVVNIDAARCYRTFCGDGTVQTTNETGQTEQCDDHNNADGDGCSATCQQEPGWSCIASGCNPGNPTVTQPNQSVTWAAGAQNVPVSWTMPAGLPTPVSYMVLLRRTTGGGQETTLAGPTTVSQGGMPSGTAVNIPPAQPVGTYRLVVRIIKNGRVAEDVGDGTVTISAPRCGDGTINGTEQCETDGQCSASTICRSCGCVNPVTVSAPATAETWALGSQHIVRWTLTAVPPDYQVFLYLKNASGNLTSLGSLPSGTNGLLTTAVTVPPTVIPDSYTIFVMISKGSKNFTDESDHPVTIVNPCGNGHLDGNEQCDDANHTVGDGCTDQCTTEAGWTCTNNVCVATRCGDGIRVGTESCESNADCASQGRICYLCTCPTMAGAALRLLDTNKNGSVTPAEALPVLENAAAALGAPTPLSDANRPYDVTGDGTVTKDDLWLLTRIAQGKQ